MQPTHCTTDMHWIADRIGEVRVHVKDEDLSFEIVPAIKKLKAKKAPKALPAPATEA
mgnify:CR=1 FL=1